ncbi:MAG: hypothetical protein ACJ8HJ_18445 [Massilia sp.]
MKHIVLATLMSLLSAQALACPLSESVMTRYGVSFSGFSTAIPESAAPDTTHGGPFVRVRMPDASTVADGFRHTIVMDRGTKKLWILRTGGFVGVYQWYGPVDAVDASLDNCRLEPTDGTAQAKRHG